MRVMGCHGWLVIYSLSVEPLMCRELGEAMSPPFLKETGRTTASQPFSGAWLVLLLFGVFWNLKTDLFGK